MANPVYKDLVVITSQDVTETQDRSKLLTTYIRDSLKEGIDYGNIFRGTKPSLFKPGAEKLAKLFRLGSRIVEQDSQMEIEKNFAYFAYTVEVYHLDSGKTLAQCQGSANSYETRYSRLKVGDLINTLQKMAQKRAFVGAVILAVGASEFYSQDLEDIEPALIKKLEPHESLLENTTKQANSTVEEYTVPLGKKFRGKKLSEIPRNDLEGFLGWLKEESKKKGKPLGLSAKEFVERAEQFLKTPPKGNANSQ